MSKTASREIRLASRPNGIPTAANFTLARTEREPPQDQQMQVRNLFMSVDQFQGNKPMLIKLPAGITVSETAAALRAAFPPKVIHDL